MTASSPVDGTTLRETHPYFAADGPPDWATRAGPQHALATYSTRVIERIEGLDSDRVASLTRDRSGPLPVLTVELSPGAAYTTTTPLGSVLNRAGSELHAPRLSEAGGLTFDVLMPPPVRATHRGKLLKDGSAPLGGAPDVVGIDAGDTLHVATRPGEVVLWPAAHPTSPFRPTSLGLDTTPASVFTDLTSATPPNAPKKSVFTDIRTRIPEPFVDTIRVDETTVPPTLTLSASASKHRTLCQTLAQLRQPITSLDQTEAGLDVTIRPVHPFYRVTHESSWTVTARKYNASTVAVAVGRALGQAGIEKSSYVTVFARPGEIHLIESNIPRAP